MLNRLQIHPVKNLKSAHFGILFRTQNSENNKDATKEVPNHIGWARANSEPVVLNLKTSKSEKLEIKHLRLTRRTQTAVKSIAILPWSGINCSLKLVTNLRINETQEGEVTFDLLEIGLQTHCRGGMKVVDEWCKERVEVKGELPKHLTDVLVRMEELQPRDSSLGHPLIEEREL